MKRTIHIITDHTDHSLNWYEGYTHAVCGAELVDNILFDGIDHYLTISKGQREHLYNTHFFVLTKDPGMTRYHLCTFTGIYDEHVCGDCKVSDDFSLAMLARVP